MNTKAKSILLGCFTLIGLVVFLVSPARAFQPPERAALPNFDKRENVTARSRASAEQMTAAAKLRDRLPNAKVDFDYIIGAPKLISTGDGFLSGPDGEGRAISKAAAAAIDKNDPHRATKAFLQEHRSLFGHGSEALDQALIKREFTTPHNGLKTVVWEQQVDDIPIFEATLISHTTSKGELVNLASHFVPSPLEAARRGTPNRAALVARPDISAAQAVALAARHLGENTQTDPVKSTGTAVGAEKAQKFNAPFLRGESDTKLIWLPMDRDTLHLCWDVVLTVNQRAEMFRILVDAQTGEILVRRCLTAYISDASYRVFTSDSPSPFSPSHPTPLTNQPPLVLRTLVTLRALDTNASPNGWIDDGINETRGNNVDAHTDRNADNIADLPRPTGSPFRVFDFAMDLATQDPTAYSNAAVVQLFYVCNWMHDKLYQLGFTEVAGNFQSTNFGRGGLANDAVQADAQDGSGMNNANFSTPPDGSPGRMQMYIYSGPTPRRDGDFDAEVVLHEYTHGLSNRRVGGGVGLSASQSRGMGEGWSDWYGLTLLSESGDNVNGNYAAGGYATFRLYGLMENYYYGVRRYPYSTDMTKNPLTFKDIDPGQASTHPGVPVSPIFGGGDPSEVHNQGEVWCVTLWEARANLIAKHGFTAGNQLILQLVTDGMNLSPGNPNFLQARDAIIQADLVLTGGANRNELWAAFAKRGMGANATSPSSSATSGVRESYDLPDDLNIAPGTGFTGSGPVGGPFTPSSATFTLTNSGAGPLTWTLINTTAWLSVSSAGGATLTHGGPAATVTVSVNASASSLPMGIYSGSVRITNLTSGVGAGRSFALRVGQPDYFTEIFEAGENDLAFSTITFTPNGSASFYAPCREVATNFPTDPTGGAIVHLGDDNYTPVALGGTSTVAIYSRRTNVFFIGSNGYLTFDYGDSEYVESPARHFDRPRVSALFDDFYPPDGGTISWRELSNRVSVTYQNVPEYDTSNQNSFQIEMFFDGRIRLTWLALAARYGLAGLSEGLGLPIAFQETDLSALNPCVSFLLVTVPTNSTEGAGVLVGQGRVTLPAVFPTNFTVNLASSRTNEVTVPPSITITAGQTNGDFDVTIVDDGELDGTQIVIITATAGNLANGRAEIAVHDNETAALQVSLPAAVTEGGASAQGLVGVSASPAANVTVSLSSSDTSELQLPPFVVIPSGQTSAVFSVTIVDDALLDGAQDATVTAHVQNWTDGTATTTVLDNESLDLVVTLPASASENAGTIVSAGAVRVSGSLLTNLVVSLSSSDSAILTLPPAVTIPAGQSIGPFDLTIVDDLLVDGTQLATVRASAPGFLNGAAVMTVLDDESPPVPSNPSPSDLASNVPANTALSWSNGRPGVTNDVYFGTNAVPGPAEFLGSTTSSNWALPLLAPNTTYYWQIVAQRIGTTAGPVWQFTTRGVDHFDISPVTSPQFVAGPFDVTITARDELNRAVTNFAGPAALRASLPVMIVPTNTGAFTDGVWSGQISVLNPATNLTLQAVAAAHFGTSSPFHVVASNQPPIILTEPASWQVRTGATVSLFVTVYGASPLSYQWRFNGGDLPGERNVSLTLSGLNTNQSGDYSVAVTNLFGSATGSIALLTVLARGVFFDDFEPDIHLPLWSTFSSTVAANNIGGSVSGVNSLWFGGAGSRFVISKSMDTRLGGVIDFYLRLADGGSQPWEKVDLPGEGIVLEYSTNSGGSWTEFGRYDTSLYYLWTHIVTDIPFAAQTASTQFRWRQLTTSGATFDQWALDDVQVTISPRPPTIISQPADQVVYAGTVAAFNVLAQGSVPLSYQWFKDGMEIPGATNANFTLVNVQTNDAVPYSVVVTNLYGSITSSTAILVVETPPPSIVAQPTSRTVGAGDTTSFMVGAIGSLPFTYQWRHNGINLTDDAHISGATGPVLTIANCTVADAGAYSVVVDNAYGTVVSSDATLALDSVSYFSLEGIASPLATNVPFIVNVFARNLSNLIVTNFTRTVTLSATNLDGGGLIPILPVVSGNFINGRWAGNVRVFTPGSNIVLCASDSAGNTGRSVALTVVPSIVPLIVTPPASQSVRVGTNVMLAVDAVGLPTLSYQWRRNGINLTDGGRISGATNSVLTLSTVLVNDAGVYSVLVTNAFGSALSSSATLTVVNTVDHFTWSLIPSPVSTLAPFGVSVQARDFFNNIFTNFNSMVGVSASIADNGTPVPVSPTVSGVFAAGVWNGSLSVPQVASNVVLRADDGGGAIGLSAPFNVEQVATFTLEPTNQNVLPGTNVTLVAGAIGTGPIRYQWRFEGSNIPNATNASYSFTNASLSNHGNFSAAAMDDLSTTVSSNAFIYVLVKPTIVRHLAPQTVLQGGNATFSLLATGATPLWYRWIRNGGGLPGMTTSVPVLVISNVQASSVIRVGVTNRASPAGTFSPGPGTANNVTLTMLPDFDGDGMADAWEAQYGFNTNSAADALLDFDGDGVSNRDEYIAGTNPMDQFSYLKFDSVETVGPGREVLLLGFSAVSNKTYTLQYRDALKAASWSNLLHFETGQSNRVISVTNAMPPAITTRYYRLVTPRSGE